MRILVCAVLFLSGTAALAAPAPNAPAPAPGHQRFVCADDAAKFCDAVPYGEGRRIDCLAKHMKQLTPGCRRVVPIMQAMVAFGKKQHERTMAAIARDKAAEEKAAREKKAAPAPKP